QIAGLGVRLPNPSHNPFQSALEQNPTQRLGLGVRDVVVNFLDGLVPAGIVIGLCEVLAWGRRAKPTRGETLWLTIGVLWILKHLVQLVVLATGSLDFLNLMAIPSCFGAFVVLIVIPPLREEQSRWTLQPTIQIARSDPKRMSER